MKCKKCGHRAIPTNLARRLFADVIATGTSVLGKTLGIPPVGTLKSVRKEICSEHTYVCPACGHLFSERFF